MPLEGDISLSAGMVVDYTGNYLAVYTEAVEPLLYVFFFPALPSSFNIVSVTTI
mgnify:FL=1